MRKIDTALQELKTGVLSESTLAILHDLLIVARFAATATTGAERDSAMRLLTEVGETLGEPDPEQQTRVNATAAATWGSDNGR